MNLRGRRKGDHVLIEAVVVKQRRGSGRTLLYIPGIGDSGQWDIPSTAAVHTDLGNVLALSEEISDD